jgi:hypothetical protein
VTIEFWLVLGASALLVVAGVARGLALLREQGRWGPVAIGGRTGAVLILTVALVLSTANQGQWSPSDLQQAVLSLALATLCAHLMLVWRCGVDGAGPVADLIALALVLVGMFVIGSGAPPLGCVRCAAPFYIQWTLYFFGAGGVMVAGSAGLLLMLRAGASRQGWGLRWPLEVDLYAFLGQATALALIALGAGLAVSAWWAWRAMGSLSGGDPREVWMASTWLVAGTSWLSWQLGKRPERWAAGLAMVAAAVAIFGLLAVVHFGHFLGI